MAIQNVIGGACRGATWVAIHNGGGVGWWVERPLTYFISCSLFPSLPSSLLAVRGEVINGGFGLVLDGSEVPQTVCISLSHKPSSSFSRMLLTELRECCPGMSSMEYASSLPPITFWIAMSRTIHKSLWVPPAQNFDLFNVGGLSKWTTTQTEYQPNTRAHRVL